MYLINYLLSPPLPTIFQQLKDWANENEQLHFLVSIFRRWMAWTWRYGSPYGFFAVVLMYAFMYAMFGYSLGHPRTLWSLLCWNITCFVYFQQTQLPGEEENYKDEEEEKIKNFRPPSILCTGLVALRFGWKAHLVFYGLCYVIYCGKLLYDAAHELKKKRDDEAVIEEKEEDHEVDRGQGLFFTRGKVKKTKRKTSMFTKNFALEVLCGEEFKGLDRKAFCHWLPRLLYDLGLVFVLAAILPRRLVMVPEPRDVALVNDDYHLVLVGGKGKDDGDRLPSYLCRPEELACVCI